MPQTISLLLLPLLSISTAWCTGLGLRRGRRGQLRGFLRHGTRLSFWLVALALVRDHSLRLFTRSDWAPSSGSLIVATATAALLALSVAAVERLRRSQLVWRKSLQGRNLLAGVGFGALVGFVAFSTRSLPALPVFTGQAPWLVLALVVAWALSAELMVRGIFTSRVRKILPSHLVILGSAGIMLLSWLGLACQGPYPFFVVVAMAAWLSLTASIAHATLDFPGALGAHASLLFLIVMPR